MNYKYMNVRAKKSLGQHFLTDVATAMRIADTIDTCPGIPVLEIGPGTGALTEHLLGKRRPLEVVELDTESIGYLNAHFPMLRDHIVEGDFLKMDLTRLFGGRPFVLTGNYPYNISSQIFFKLIDNRDRIPCCTGMIQKEVAERLCSGPGTKHYGILSVLLQAWYDTEYLFTVPPSVFNPPPKVDSAVVRFTRNSVTALGCDETLFRRVVKTAFNQRRKMMRGSLKPLLTALDTERGISASPERHAGFFGGTVLTQRPERLSVQDFVDLTNAIDAECRPQ